MCNNIKNLFKTEKKKKEFSFSILNSFLSLIPASLLDLIPDDEELASISIFFVKNIEPPEDDVSVVEYQGFVRIRHLCLGDGAIDIHM